MIMKKQKTKRKGEFEMPGWMECFWKRKSCGKKGCPVCGRIEKDHEKNIERGENPDEMKFALDDLGKHFKETLDLVKKDAEKMGIDITNIDDIQAPPEPEKYPLCIEVVKWRDSVYSLIENKELPLWAYTEAADDLFWYSNTICAKTYRQFCNKWQIEKGDKFGDFDYEYTKYVLSECFDIIQKSISELIPTCTEDKMKLMFVSDSALKLKAKVLKI